MNPVKALQKLINREPAVILGAVATAATVGAEAVQTAPTWQAAVPLLLSVAIRRFVSSPATVEAILNPPAPAVLSPDEIAAAAAGVSVEEFTHIRNVLKVVAPLAMPQP